MRIREIQEEFPWTVTQSRERSPGLHLTGVIKAMESILSEGGAISDDTRMQFEKGWLWEEALSQAFGQKAAVRVGEVWLDGIAGSPDGVVYGEDGKPTAIEEYKCTAKSPNTTPADVWRWIMQVKGYCKMVGVRRCVFRVLHLSFVPVYHVWELTFSQRELDENWAAIVAQAETMKG